jgi:DNA-binding transcriptional MerR regulator
VTPRLHRDPDAITRSEAAVLLGVSVDTVRRMRGRGLLVGDLGPQHLYSRSEIEAFIADPWLTGAAAAKILGVGRTRVSQLASDDKIPFRLTTSGRRVYRESQTRVVANARHARREGALAPSDQAATESPRA